MTQSHSRSARLIQEEIGFYRYLVGESLYRLAVGYSKRSKPGNPKIGKPELRVYVAYLYSHSKYIPDADHLAPKIDSLRISKDLKMRRSRVKAALKNLRAIGVFDVSGSPMPEHPVFGQEYTHIPVEWLKALMGGADASEVITGLLVAHRTIWKKASLYEVGGFVKSAEFSKLLNLSCRNQRRALKSLRSLNLFKIIELAEGKKRVNLQKSDGQFFMPNVGKVAKDDRSQNRDKVGATAVNSQIRERKSAKDDRGVENNTSKSAKDDRSEVPKMTGPIKQEIIKQYTPLPPKEPDPPNPVGEEGRDLKFRDAFPVLLEDVRAWFKDLGERCRTQERPLTFVEFLANVLECSKGKSPIAVLKYRFREGTFTAESPELERAQSLVDLKAVSIQDSVLRLIKLKDQKGEEEKELSRKGIPRLSIREAMGVSSGVNLYDLPKLLKYANEGEDPRELLARLDREEAS